MADVLSLQQPVGDGGIETVNFFNGRLLTAADMAREQDARRQADARLGLAMGDGVAFGLEVTASTVADDEGGSPLPAVAIEPGLAINRAGQVLRLGYAEQVRLSRIGAAQTGAAGCSFSDCAPVISGSYVAGQGLYILTIAPSGISAGRAPTNGLSGGGAACNVDRVIEAVQFRLLAVPRHLYAALDAAAPGYRNNVAYTCFGSGVRAGWATSLRGRAGRDDGLLDAMRGYGLTDQDVPLAVMAFAGAASMVFLDNWAVRRPVNPPDPAPGSLPSLVAPRRLATGRAMLHQFQDQLAQLVGSSGSLGAVSARSHFPMLPPVGILPQFTTGMAKAFFAGMEARGPQHINSAQLETLLRESLSASAFPAGAQEVFWLYAVADNRIAAELASADDGVPDPYLVFSSANLAYRADARFNLHRWDYANIALSA
ncbi:hypothetical protein [Novosphingobium sp. AP12]|uniref:hypothetical protein n=1 Tax=Novosphingobium sp. AP12 TaxID=1144305 RepID=UPI000271E7C6|nr:hypothetical protein [Novosphingobium sp. AP12]EJL23180.1 hypothetical protein PMI02_04261 [Novosphingobium sp. AP12]